MWRALCKEFGLDADDPRFATNEDRVARRNLVTKAIEEPFSLLPAEECLRRLNNAGVPAGRVRTLDEVYSWDQTRSQVLVISVQHTTLREVELPGCPIRFGDNRYSGGMPRHAAPPTLGSTTRPSENGCRNRLRAPHRPCPQPTQ
jgi:crotonobetainyl-CoA:carnitine CoA-transferase CaiB-like acyl-CoA transferase